MSADAYEHPLARSCLDGFYVLTSGAGDHEYDRLLPRLTASERARVDQFLLLEDRLAFAIGRVLVRKTLSQYCAEPQGGWQLTQNAFGKPEIVPVPGVPDLRFNISHSSGIVAAAFSIARHVGIDTELVTREIDCLEIARSQFSAAEIATLEDLPKQQLAPAFFALWTLREAYTKALGVGLTTSLSRIAFSLDPPAMSSSLQLPEGCRDWFFWQNQPSPFHVLSVAALGHPAEVLSYRQDEVDLRELY